MPKLNWPSGGVMCCGDDCRHIGDMTFVSAPSNTSTTWTLPEGWLAIVYLATQETRIFCGVCVIKESRPR